MEGTKRKCESEIDKHFYMTKIMQTGLDYKSRWVMHFYMYIASFKKQITKNPQPFIKR